MEQVREIADYLRHMAGLRQVEAEETAEDILDLIDRGEYDDAERVLLGYGLEVEDIICMAA